MAWGYQASEKPAGSALEAWQVPEGLSALKGASKNDAQPPTPAA